MEKVLNHKRTNRPSLTKGKAETACGGLKEKISIHALSKDFIARREKVRALENVDMAVYAGEFVSIVGPSGCGKSTIIRILNGLIKRTSGTISIDDYQYTNKPVPKEVLKKIGLIFQLPNLYPWLTVRQNICLPLKVYGIKDKEYYDYADFLLEKYGLAPYAASYPDSVSYGMSQRAGVVRAMTTRPEILMMDEPFGALDESTREDMDLDLLALWKETGATIIFITHNIGEAILLSQRIYIMASTPGRIIKEVPVNWAERGLFIYKDPDYSVLYKTVSDAIGEVSLDYSI
jgi:NitT/TauT family transport system ATP-binding protein